MKRSLIMVSLLATATIMSCNKETAIEPSDTGKVSVSFKAASVETKTVFGDKASDGSYPLLWSGDETIGISFNGTSAVQVTPAISNGGASADFNHEFEVPDGTTSYKFRLFSPYGALLTKTLTSDSFYANIPSTQASTPQGPDPGAQLLYAITDDMTSIPESVPLTFSHITAYLHIFFKNVSLASGAAVQSVSISAPSDCYLAGRTTYDAGTQAFTYTAGYVVSNILVNTSSIDDGIWCGIMPADLKGKSLTITINTDKGTISKVITIPENDGATLTPGAVLKFTVNMDGITFQDPVEFELVTSAGDLYYGDQVVIASAEADVAIATNAYSSSQASAGVERSGDIISDPSSSVEIITLGDGLIPGSWSLRKQDGTYLSGKSGANALIALTEVTAEGSWEISFGDLTDVDKSSPDAERAIIGAHCVNPRYIRYKPSDNYFCSYHGNTGSGQNPVKLYRKKGAADTTPRFKVTCDDGTIGDIEVNSSEQTVSLYVFGNVNWTASVTGDATLDATSGNGPAILNLAVPENLGASTTYVVTVSTSASVATQSYTINVVQDKGFDKVLSFDFTDSGKLSGWPVSSKTTSSNTAYSYSLNEEDYSFILNGTVYFGGSYLVINASSTLGMPAIEGYVLKMVHVYLGGTKNNRNVAITSDTSGTAVSGGENASVPYGTDHIFTLSGTLSNTVYYVRNSSGGIPLNSVTLGYIKDDSASGSSVSAGQAGAPMQNPFLIYSF